MNVSSPARSGTRPPTTHMSFPPFTTATAAHCRIPFTLCLEVILELLGQNQEVLGLSEGGSSTLHFLFFALYIYVHLSFPSVSSSLPFFFLNTFFVSLVRCFFLFFLLLSLPKSFCLDSVSLPESFYCLYFFLAFPEYFYCHCVYS